jgi:hypothetical protein
MEQIMKISAIVAFTLTLLAPLTASAGLTPPETTIPEPATLTLMAVGVAGALIASRFRNKK